MRREPKTPHRIRALAFVGCVGILAVLATGCSSSGSGSGTAATTSTTQPPTAGTTSSAPSTIVAPSTSSTPTTPATTAANANLSGKWSGRYNGAFSGTFNLSWQQTQSTLVGSITLSAPSNTLSLNGTVKGTTINFGTVGSAAITYSGTVSGKSMSGTYHVNGATGGNWSATESP